MGRIFTNGLLLRDGADHKHHRKIMHEAFTRPALRDYADRMNPIIARGIDEFGASGAPILAFRAYKQLTLELAASIFVGMDLGPTTRPMNQAFEDMVAASMSRVRLPRDRARVPARPARAQVSARAARRHAREEARRRGPRHVQPAVPRAHAGGRRAPGRGSPRPHDLPDDGRARHDHEHLVVAHLRAGRAPRVAGARARGEPGARHRRARPRGPRAARVARHGDERDPAPLPAAAGDPARRDGAVRVRRLRAARPAAWSWCRRSTPTT